jgi:hypothetical protein
MRMMMKKFREEQRRSKGSLRKSRKLEWLSLSVK